MNVQNTLSSVADTISAARAADLMKKTIRMVQLDAQAGKLRTDAGLSAYGGGNGGTTYRVYVDSLPVDAQIRYYQETAAAELGHAGPGLDLVGYRARNGEDGMAELLSRQRAVLAVHGLRRLYDTNRYIGFTKELKQLATKLDVPHTTLLRWETRYTEMGLNGLIRKEREDAGKSRSMCLLARDYVEFLMCDSRKPPETMVKEEVQRIARQRGADACERCPYRRASAERNELAAEGKTKDMPVCERAGAGMIPPDTRHAVNRAVKLIPESVLAYARYGSRYWEANYMQKCKREKPELVNECWFGDHHKLDLFVLDRDGRPVRPWLTAWEDAMSGALVGWMLTLEPNSDTIATSFARASVATKGSIFRGLPMLVYIDNGKDYRSMRFEGGQITEYSIGRLNEDFCNHSLLEYLGVEVKHAIPYRAWTKPIERMFGTFEKRWVKRFPGWCGDSPDERPQDLGREIKRLMEHGELMTFDTFAELFKRDVIDAYHNFAGSDGKTPIALYQSVRRARTDDPDAATMAMINSQKCSRVVTYQGVKLDKQIYQDAALADYVGKDVTVLYQRGDNPSVSVMYENRFVCEAEPIEVLKMIERDTEKLGRHMAMQQRQRKAVTGRIAAIEQNVRGVHREAYTEEIDEQRDEALARVGSLEARKVAKAKGEVEVKRRRRAGEQDESGKRADRFFTRIGEAAIKKAKEG